MSCHRRTCLALALAAFLLGSWPAEIAAQPGDPPRRADAELIEAWGRGVLTGPIPETPEEVAPPPTLPEDCLVLDSGLDASASLAAVVLTYLGKQSRRPGEGEPEGTTFGGAWRPLTAQAPGAWSGTFDHAFLRVKVMPREQVCFVRLTGAELMIVNGEPFLGDPQRRGLRGVPVALTSGVNDVFVCGANGAFEIEFWSPRTRVVLGTWDAAMVDLFGVPLPLGTRGEQVCVPVFNASTSVVRGLHFHYGHGAVSVPGLIPPLTEWACGGTIAPLCFLSKELFLSDMGQAPGDPAWAMPLCAHDGWDRDADRQLAHLVPDVLSEHATRFGSLTGAERLLFDERGTVFVYATAGNAAERAQALAMARFLQQAFWYRAGRAARVIADRDLADGDVTTVEVGSAALLVLVGDAKRSLAWRQLRRFDDLCELLPADIGGDADAEFGLRLVGPTAMPATLPRRIALVHNRSGGGLRLLTALRLSDERLAGASLTITPGDRRLLIRPAD